MISSDGIEFKNPEIETILRRGMAFTDLLRSDPVRAQQIHHELTPRERCEIILGGYWGTLLLDVMVPRVPNDKWLDFTYETLRFLPISVTALYNYQRESYAPERNAAVIGKTVAAYLYGLAMNEHGYKLRMGPGRKAPLWGGRFNICIDGKEPVDFLSAGLSSVNALFTVENGVFIDGSPFIQAYPAAAGVDLNDYGFGSMVITAHD